MKKYLPDINDFNDVRENNLDRLSNLVYNIRIGYKKKRY